MVNLSESIKRKSSSLRRRVGDGVFFNSKLLLFGEYGLMYDAMALSVPFPKFSGYLDLDTDHSNLESTAEIRKFYEHLKTGDTNQNLHFPFGLENMKTDLAKGLFFNSDIPQQYGVGSSGALVAALFSRYAFTALHENDLSPEMLKVDFSLLESYFHGRSSGLDPLTSFLNQPLLIGSKKTIQTVHLDLAHAGLSIALIDTKTTGATGPLVKYFIDLLNFQEFRIAFKSQFVPLNNGCIESLLNGNNQTFFLFLDLLIRFQLQHFSRMIPENFHALISDALDERVFIKLLGSGGGGFLLAFADSESVVKRWAEKHVIELEMVV